MMSVAFEGGVNLLALRGSISRQDDPLAEGLVLSSNT